MAESAGGRQRRRARCLPCEHDVQRRGRKNHRQRRTGTAEKPGRRGSRAAAERGQHLVLGLTAQLVPADQDFGPRSPEPQHSAPRFGEFGDDSRGRAERRYEDWESGGRSDPEDRNRAGEVGKALVKMVPTVVFLIIFIGFFSSNGFFSHGFSFWWIALVILVPQVIDLVKKVLK